MSRLLIIELFANLLHKLAVIIKLAKEVARQLVVRLAGSTTIHIKRYAEFLKAVLNKIMVAVHHLLDCDSLLAGTDGNRHTMLIRASDEQYVPTFQTQIAHINVGGNIDTCQMANMNRTVCVWQSGRNKGSFEMLFHLFYDNFAQRYDFFCL